MAVHPNYRSQCRGDKLLLQIEHIARARGVERVFVLTSDTSQ